MLWRYFLELQQFFHKRQSRRSILRQFGMLTGMALTLDACDPFATQVSDTTLKGVSDYIQHVIIACQENHSFDEYFGYYPKAGKFSVPSNYSQPDGKGGIIKPYHFTSPVSQDPNHFWYDIHREWNNGAMNGFFANGYNTLGYYDGSDLKYYYALADSFTLCGNYFCSVLGPTVPNRLTLVSGTCGGMCLDEISAGSLDYPTIVDLLDAHNITWKCYNLGLGTGSTASEHYNPLTFFKKWQNDPRLQFKEDDYYMALHAGTLHMLSFLITEGPVSEHPPQDIQKGQKKMSQVINALISSSAWKSSALFFTYDEAGGFFDHVVPPRLDAYGLGFRVPMLVISPFVKRGYISGQLFEHSSILKFIERRFRLPSLASINHQFDTSTPIKNNKAAVKGQSYGPPSSPRDGLSKIGDFYDIFDFPQDANYYPSLPSLSLISNSKANVK